MAFGMQPGPSAILHCRLESHSCNTEQLLSHVSQVIFIYSTFEDKKCQPNFSTINHVVSNKQNAQFQMNHLLQFKESETVLFIAHICSSLLLLSVNKDGLYFTTFSNLRHNLNQPFSGEQFNQELLSVFGFTQSFSCNTHYVLDNSQNKFDPLALWYLYLCMYRAN